MTSIIDSRRPEFAIAIRGYDRVQVEEYVERLARLLEEAEERARRAESELEFSAHASVGPRVGEIFELAMAEAKELRAGAERESRDVLAVARANAEELVEEARAKAERITADARAEHEELLSAFASERERLQRSVVELEQRREAVLGQLRRLYEALGSAAGIAPGRAAAALEAATTQVVQSGAEPLEPAQDEELTLP
jgi:cell division septum initiation protein DivIVA